jgi:hypothetical protein
MQELWSFETGTAFAGAHVDDLLGRLKKKWPELVILEFPALAEKDERWRKKGEPLFPEHKPLEMLLDQKKVMSEASWAAEYQQRSFLTGSGAIPIEKLKILPYFSRDNIAATVLAVDKAGIEGGDGAYTAIVIMHRMRDGTFVIERVIRGHWGALERERIIKQWADDTRHIRDCGFEMLLSPRVPNMILRTAWFASLMLRR